MGSGEGRTDDLGTVLRMLGIAPDAALPPAGLSDTGGPDDLVDSVDEVVSAFDHLDEEAAQALADHVVQRTLADVEAPYVHLEVDRWVTSTRRLVLATGFDRDGNPTPLGFGVLDPDDPHAWAEFLLDLRLRGLRGVRVLALSEELPALYEVRPAVVFPMSRPTVVGPLSETVIDLEALLDEPCPE